MLIKDICDDFIEGYTSIKQCEKKCPEVMRLSSDYFKTDLNDLFVVRCHKTNAIINLLEQDGWCEKIEDLFMSNSTSFEESFKTANAEYILFRHYLIKKNIENESIKNELILDSARFGIENVESKYEIKCLHKHYAHYIATGNNPIGRIVSILIERYKADNETNFETECLCN